MAFVHISLGGANLLGILIVVLVGSVAFVGLGLMAAVLPVMSPERGAEATHIFQGVLLLLGVVLVPLGLRVFNLAEAWAKRNGKLKRTG